MPILKESESTFEPVPAGTHPARCYQMVSLGTQPPGNPQFKPSFQVVLGFELPNEQIERNGERFPMSTSQFLNAKLGTQQKPSNTRKFIEAWRGKAFTAAEISGFDLSKVVGAPCLLNIIHEDRNGKTNAKIASISPLPKGMTMSGQINPSIVYEIEQGRNEVFKALPEWLQKKIELCEEWQHPAAATQAEDAAGGESDDIPF